MRYDGSWSLDVVGQYWKSTGESLYVHQSESVGERWEDEYIGTSVYLCEFFFALGAEECYFWKSFLK